MKNECNRKRGARTGHGFGKWPIRPLFLVSFILLAVQKAYSIDPLRIYFVRHAESGHNVLHEWKYVPKSLWPSFVGNENVFTPKGEKQIIALTEQLKTMKFDFIAVSPYWRTRNTILPYLKETGKKGEIWPELTETPSIHADWTSASAQLPRPNPNLFSGGEAIVLPDAERPFFVLRADSQRLLDARDSDNLLKIANSVALAQKTVDRIKSLFGRSNKSILLVGHGNSGSTLLRVLTTAKTNMTNIDNIGLWMAEEQTDGTFKLKILDGMPCRN